MATYYIQTDGAWQSTTWRTVYRTNDKGLAEYLTKALAISENAYGIGNPGLTGAQFSRYLSKTRLRREDGAYALVRAEEDLELGEDRTIDRLIESYHEEQKEKAQEGKIDFLIRDLPQSVHDQVKAEALARGSTIRECIIGKLRSHFSSPPNQ